MERLLILLAVLAIAAAATAVAAMAARARRPPLHMDSEFDADDADLIVGSVRPPGSPIDRSAPVLDARPPEAPPALEAPDAPRRIAGQGETRGPDPATGDR